MIEKERDYTCVEFMIDRVLKVGVCSGIIIFLFTGLFYSEIHMYLTLIFKLWLFISIVLWIFHGYLAYDLYKFMR
jgi:hypothetical protein